ncbi:hypothetical protein NL676_031790 [Syzygium grande]|nr:hypothetical protein NL676_031790 [Syzygium grande]
MSWEMVQSRVSPSFPFLPRFPPPSKREIPKDGGPSPQNGSEHRTATTKLAPPPLRNRTDHRSSSLPKAKKPPPMADFPFPLLRL